MALATQYVIGCLTAICTSLVVVMLLWRLSRCCVRARPPCCDVIDPLLDACHAVMGAAILVLVVADDGGGVSCAAPGFVALCAGAQTLCLLATRSVVMATGGSRDPTVNRCDGGHGKEVDRPGGGWSWFVPLLIIQVSIITVFTALPLSDLPIATTAVVDRNHSAVSAHLTCLPLTWGSRDTPAWYYTCFLLVAVGWLPLLVASSSDVFYYCAR